MTLRFAIFGTGFWSRYQLAGWRELEGVECVALYNRTRSKAEALAREFGVPAVYDDPEELLHHETVDFVDVIAHVDVHSALVHLAARYKIPVICQKPMAPDLETARQMVEACQEAGVPFMVHENWRWQYPIQQVKRALQEGEVGRPFRAHITYANSAPVFDNHPYLKELDRFILNDMGSHILDGARLLFGEASSLYCQVQRVRPGIQGEDVATVLLRMGDGISVTCELSYASLLERERFPQAHVLIEAEHGSLELAPDYWVRETTKQGTWAQRFPPPRYAWADPAYDLVHASILECHRNLLGALRHESPAETTGIDNLQTVRLVFAAYDSAQQDAVIHLA